jgi:hypothetical protein
MCPPSHPSYPSNLTSNLEYMSEQACALPPVPPTSLPWSSKAKSSEAAASASSALVGVHSLSSVEPELSSISDPEAVDEVIDVGKWNDDGTKRKGFKALTLEEFGLLVVKLHSSQNVKVLNLAGNKIGAEGAGRLAEPLVKLTALQVLNLSGTV